MSFRKILIAVDGEPLAAHAAKLGVSLAASLEAEVALIYVVEPVLAQAPGVAPEELIAEDRREGRDVLAGLSHLTPPEREPTRFLPTGNPASEIVRTAGEWGAELIVMGSHARHGIQRALLGSVAEAVMRHAPCPVLIVPAKR